MDEMVKKESYPLLVPITDFEKMPQTLAMFGVMLTILTSNVDAGFSTSQQHLQHTGIWNDRTLQNVIGLKLKHSTYLAASIMDEPITIVESKRLVKAKQLLEQFQQNDEVAILPESTNATNGSTNTRETNQLTTRTTTSSRITTRSMTPIKMSNPNGEDISPSMENFNVVPDNFWRNGHLQDSYSSSSTSSTSTKMAGNMNSKNGEMFVTRWSRGANVAEPLVQYDPIKAERLLFRQPTKWMLRNFQIAVPLGWWAVNVVIDYLLYRGVETTDQQTQRRRERAKQLTKAISSLGPAIIKGGQALASRPDLLPAEYLEELQKLQDDVPRFSNDVALKTVVQELEIQQFTDLFELIQDEPVAAASIGQVYKARLVENGDIVALKIQRPSCEEIVALDLYILRWWSGVYNQIIFRLLNRDIDLQNIIDDFGVLIYRELDYVAEASNAQRFNELYAGITPDVFVPKIYSDYTTSRVLTMEWVDGYRITDTKTMNKLGLNERKLVNTLVQCSVRQILGS
jgi:ABC1 atypical kinase-like domain